MDSVAPGKGKSPGIHVRVCGQTDVGRVREHNEDNFLVADLTRKAREFDPDDMVELGRCGAVFGVCDGMGGAAAGEVASQLAVDLIYERLVGARAPRGREDLARRLVRAVQDAGVRIFGDARTDRSRRGMGTTATIATLMDDRLFLAQVGDSRAYVLRDGELVQVTRDQSLANQLIEAGQLTEEEAETFEHNNIILQALGTSEAVQVDLTYVDLRADDTLVICSDGLSGMVRSEDLRGVLVESEEPQEVCNRLIQAANDAGGHDNITVVVVKFEGPGVPALAEGDDELAYRKYAFVEEDDAAAESTPAGDEGAASRDTTRLPPVSRRRAAEAGDAQAPESTASPSSASDESVAVPMEGWDPRTVGAIVAAGFTIIIVMGFLLLK